MDKSVDSIGSCSLDVDADSTDFSDTSGSLNLATPSSAKDITKEFTSKFKERCQISQINCQQATTILDPLSDEIKTIITPASDSLNISPAKKPSYLNLACCVNGYSNLTTYDSKLRQDINKSREVSPIRPSTNSLQYCRAFGNFLAPPSSLPVVPMPVYNTNKNKSLFSSQPSSFLSGEENMTDTKIYNIQEKTVTTQPHGRGVDLTDNVSRTTQHRSATKYYNSTLISSSVASDITIQRETKTPKSFIQQRVERLYGPDALAQGFCTPKKTRSLHNNTVPCERLKNAQNQYLNSNNYVNESENKTFDINNHHQNYNSCRSNNNILIDNNKMQNYDTLKLKNTQKDEDLPVLRHLRPEFRAQLPILSVKRSQQQQTTTINKLIKNLSLNGNSTTTVANTALTNGINDKTTNNQYMNSNEKQLIQQQEQYQKQQTKINNSHKGDFVDDKSADKYLFSTKEILDTGSDMQKITSSSIVVCNDIANKQVSIRLKDNSEINADDNNKSINSGLNIDNTNKNQITNNLAITLAQVIPATATKCDKKNIDDNSIKASNSIRDGHYFLQLLKTEQNRLLNMASEAEKEIEILSNNCEISDEIFGYLRSASGKARLLVSQKMKQFEGLCNSNISQPLDEKFPTTAEDLQGFWDMVMLQVDHVNSLFKEIEDLKMNGWKKPIQEGPSPPTGSKLVRRPNPRATINTNNPKSSVQISNGVHNKKNSSGSSSAERREAQRKQLMELKRKNKQQQQQQQNLNNEVEIFVSDNNYHLSS